MYGPANTCFPYFKERIMPLDPTKNPDWKIAEAAEKNMKTVYELAEELGLEKEELLPHGHHVAKLDFAKILKRLKKRKDLQPRCLACRVEGVFG